MPNPYFRFKQFTVYHDRCAMKVGTDGCLLGAWAKANSPKYILDIGTGTGLISLMLAQRFPEATIDAVEIEPTCARQAHENIQQSPWRDRISIHHSSIQAFEAAHRYELIVSNPPYFTNAFAAPDKNRHQARHDSSLSVQDLIHQASRLLSADGVLCVILPVDRFETFDHFATVEQLQLQERVNVMPTPTKETKRILLKYSRQSHQNTVSCFYIEEKRGQYSEHFTKLLEDFYLYL